MYAMYLRKSRADIEAEALGEMETLARHQKILTELAKRQGLVVSKIYKEIVSGESIADRPEMQRLLEAVYQKNFKGVLVVEVERLARGDTRDQGVVSEAFKYSGTLIVTPVKTYDPNNEYDEEYFEFGLFMSRREYKTIQRRLQTGKLQSIKEGNYMGSLPPYGYDVVRPNKKERTLVPNEQAEYVKLMFSWFVDDRLNPGEIARRLTSMGVPTLTGKREWNRATIKDILKNNLYCGLIRWYRRKRTKEFEDGVMSKKKRRQLSEDYLVAKGKHPALISQETFDAAQKLFTASVPVNTGTVVVNPFAGLLCCSACGRKMAFHSYRHKTGNTKARIVHQESQFCKVKSAPFDEVMDAICERLQSLVSDFEFKVNNSSIEDDMALHASLVASQRKELAKLETRREKLFEFLEDGTYSRAEFVERKDAISAKIETLKVAIAELEDSAPVNDYDEKIIKYTEVIASLRNPAADAKSKNDLLKGIFEKIEYSCEDLGRQKGGNVTLDLFLA